MKIGNEEVKSFMTVKQEFSGIRIMDDLLQPVVWSLEFDTVAVDYSQKGSPSEIERNGTYAFNKLSFWMDTVLHGLIVTNIENKSGVSIASLASNAMMYCPDEPSDDILSRLIHCKLDAMFGEHLYIDTVRLSSSDSGVTYTFCPGKTGNHLPETVASYCSIEALHSEPWWYRKDGFCFELLRPTGSEKPLKEIYSGIIDPLEYYDETVAPLENDEIEFEIEPAPVIQVDKWTPKKV